MPTVNDFHPKAMDLAETAFRLKRRGEYDRAKQMFGEALLLERQAAALLPLAIESEPSRSILYRSAASLAYNAEDYEVADWLVANGLAGFPPPEIKDELKNLYEDINFMRHLSAKGLELSHDQWLMTLSGNATAYGRTLVDQLMLRVDKVTAVFYRTVERLLKLPYRTNGSVSKEIKDSYSLYINAFMPSSFAVSFQLGHPNPQIPLFPEFGERKPIEPEVVIDEVIKCFEILESHEPGELRERFADENYYQNFVGIAKQIAPDGDAIKLVGFTTIREGQERPLALRKNRQQLRETQELGSKQIQNNGDEPSSTKTYKGILRYANSPTTRKFGVVKLIDGIDSYTIKVPHALMKDIVQPFYEERVSIIVTEKGNSKFLEEINLDI